MELQNRKISIQSDRIQTGIQLIIFAETSSIRPMACCSYFISVSGYTQKNTPLNR